MGETPPSLCRNGKLAGQTQEAGWAEPRLAGAPPAGGERGSRGASGSESRAWAARASGLRAGGGAASAGQPEWSGRSQAAPNKIRGKCRGPGEHRVLPPAGRAEEAQETLNVPSDAYGAQGPEATRAPARPGGQL